MNQRFTFQWKSHRWDFRRPKISYIPSDRNLVASIPQWSKLPLEYDNLLDFMNDWDNARKQSKQVDNLLDLGLSYRYDSLSSSDSIVLPSGKPIRLSDSSSGVQSLVPLFVHLNYLFGKKSKKQSDYKQTYEQKEESKINVNYKILKDRRTLQINPKEKIFGKEKKVGRSLEGERGL